MKNTKNLNTEIYHSHYKIILNLIDSGENQEVCLSLKNTLTNKEYEKSNLKMKDFHNSALSDEVGDAFKFFNSIRNSIIKSIEVIQKDEILNNHNECKNSSIFNPYDQALSVEENEELSLATLSFNFFPNENSPNKELIWINLPLLQKGLPAPLVKEDLNKNNYHNKTEGNEENNLEKNKAGDESVNKKGNLVKNALKKLMLIFPLILGLFCYKNQQQGLDNISRIDEIKNVTNIFNDSIKIIIPADRTFSGEIKTEFEKTEMIDYHIDQSKLHETETNEKTELFTAKGIIEEFSTKIDSEAVNDFKRLIKTFCKSLQGDIYNFDMIVKIKRKSIEDFFKKYESIRIFKKEIINKPHLLFFISFKYGGNINSIGIYQDKALSEIDKVFTIKDEKSFIIDATRNKVFKSNANAEYNIRNHRSYFFQFGNTNNFDGISMNNNALYISNTNQFIFDDYFKAKKRISIKDIIEFKIFTFKK